MSPNMARKLMVMLLILAAAGLFGPTRPAGAHKVKVFAAVEGTTIAGYAYFPGGGRVKNARISLLDPQGRTLGRVTADERQVAPERQRGRGADTGQSAEEQPTAGERRAPAAEVLRRRRRPGRLRGTIPGAVEGAGEGAVGGQVHLARMEMPPLWVQANQRK